MVNEVIFRVLLLVDFLAFIVIWCRSFILSGLNRDDFYTSTEGFVGAALLRILLSTSVFCIFIYLLKPQYMNWSHLLLPSQLRSVGFPIGLLSIFLLCWILKTLGRNFSATLNIKNDQVLITHGPYRLIRHPMYITFIILWISFFLLSSNWFIGLTGVSTYVVIFIMRVPKEEQMTIIRFGNKYISYMKQTGRYFPKCTKYQKDKY